MPEERRLSEHASSSVIGVLLQSMMVVQKTGSAHQLEMS
jgi:hypothetical protein